MARVVLDAIISASTAGFIRDVEKAKATVTGLAKVAGNKAVLGGLAAGGAAGPLLGLVSNLTQAGAAIGVMPAALVTVQAAVGTVKLAFDGVSEAIKSGGKDMGNLNKEAQDLVRQVVKMKPALDDIKKTAAKNMMPGLTDALKAAEPLIPTVNEGIGKIAESIGGVAREAGKEISNPLFKSDLAIILDNNAHTIDSVGSAAVNLIPAFRDILSVGSSVLAVVTESSAGWTQQITNWVAAKRASGELYTEMMEGVQQVKEFAASIGHLAGVIIDVMGAAQEAIPITGGSLAELTRKMHEWTSSAEGQAKLIKIFEGIDRVSIAVTSTLSSMGRSIKEHLGPVVEKMGNAFKDVVGPAFSDIATGSGSLLDTMLGNIGDALERIDWYTVAELVGKIADAFARWMGVVGQGGFLSIMAGALNLLLGALNGIPHAVDLIVIAFIAWRAYNMLAMITPVISYIMATAIPALFSFGVTLWTTVLPAIGAWIVSALGAAAAMIAATWPILAIIAAVALLAAGVWLLIENWDAVWNWIKSSAQAVADWFAGPFASFFTETIPGWWNTAWESVANFFSSIWDRIKSIAQGVWTWFDENILNFFTNTVPTKFGQAGDAIASAFGKGLDKIKGLAATPINFFINTIYNSGLRAAVNKVAGVFGMGSVAPYVNPVRWANGGINKANNGYLPDQATIQPGKGQGLFQWAEGETGGEAFIPLAASKRNRSMGILSEVANMFGYGLMPNADGNIYKMALGGIGRAARGVYNYGKDKARAAAAKVAETTINKVIKPLVNRIPGGNSGFGKTIKGMAGNLLDSAVSWIRGNANGGIYGGIASGRVGAKNSLGNFSFGGGNMPDLGMDMSGAASAGLAGVQGGSISVNTITVQGSVIAEDELFEKIYSYLEQRKKRSG